MPAYARVGIVQVLLAAKSVVPYVACISLRNGQPPILIYPCEPCLAPLLLFAHSLEHRYTLIIKGRSTWPSSSSVGGCPSPSLIAIRASTKASASHGSARRLSGGRTGAAPTHSMYMAALRVMETVSISACLNAAYEQLLRWLTAIAAPSGPVESRRKQDGEK